MALDPRNIAESPENACEKINYWLKNFNDFLQTSNESLGEFKKLVDDIIKSHKHEVQAFKTTSEGHQNYAYPIPHIATPGFVDRRRRSDCTAGWWTTSGNIGLPPTSKGHGQ